MNQDHEVETVREAELELELELERKHREGYEKQPVEPGELDVWEDEQAWGD